MLFTAEMLYELDSFTAFFFHNFQHSQTGITISFFLNKPSSGILRELCFGRYKENGKVHKREGKLLVKHRHNTPYRTF